MQLAVIEYAQSILGWDDANSREFDEDSTHLVIDLMDAQRNITDKGGTMRLGAYPCSLAKGSVANKVYGSRNVSERHRHRYEVSSAWVEALIEGWFRYLGSSPDELVEMFELSRTTSIFWPCQFHPETATRPHPLFVGFL